MFAIVEYISEQKIHLYTESNKDTSLNIKELLEKYKCMKKAIIIVQYNYKHEKINEFLSQLFKNTDLDEYLITTPTILLQYTFMTKSVFYINANFVHFDEFETVYLGSLVNVNKHPIEVDNLKKQAITNDCYIECYLEYLYDSKQTSIKVDGKIEDCIQQIHTETNVLDHVSELLNAIYVDSLSLQLKTLIQNKLLMYFCRDMHNMNDSISMIRFLQPPSFLKEVRFVWKTVQNDGVLVGALRLNKIFEEEKIPFNKKANYMKTNKIEWFDKMLDK